MHLLSLSSYMFYIISEHLKFGYVRLPSKIKLDRLIAFEEIFIILNVLYFKPVRKLILDAVNSYDLFILLVQVLQPLLIFGDLVSYSPGIWHGLSCHGSFYWWSLFTFLIYPLKYRSLKFWLVKYIYFFFNYSYLWCHT